jgi:pimeloyl-ACP methyl ester carboxylesterase
VWVAWEIEMNANAADTGMTGRPVLVFLLAAAAALAVTACPSRTAARGADGPQPVTITTGDGVRLSARYFAGTQGAKSPAVLVLDDLDADALPAACDEVAKQLVKAGCTVLCFDFRGCGKSTGVEPEFWDVAANQKLVRGYKADDPPEAVRFADFKPGYLPALVNDVAAARAHLERRNDARECNTGQLYVVGFGRGATLGQLWVASEWARFRVTGAQNRVSAKPEGQDVAGLVWVGPRLALDRQPVPMFDLMKQALARKTTRAGLLYDADDAEAAELAKRCQAAFNAKDKAPLVAAHAVERATGSPGVRAAVVERVGKLVAGMREVQEMPLWENRNFGDRRYAWAFRGGPVVPAKDEGDDHFQPLPVDQLLKR